MLFELRVILKKPVILSIKTLCHAELQKFVMLNLFQHLTPK